MLNNQNPAWKALETHAAETGKTHLRDVLGSKNRYKGFSLSLPGFLIDYSRQRVTAQTMDLLRALATACDVAAMRDKMFSGDIINTSEKRAVLHTALRRPSGDVVNVNGENVMPAIHATLDRMKKCVDSIHSGRWKGQNGRVIDTIVNIGIGGSDLGPRMVVRALKKYCAKDIQVHFVSNVDGSDLYSVLQDCNPETTVFLIASKTFTTAETMANAQAAREWVVAHFRDLAAIPKHFIALSTNLKAVNDFGIPYENMFPFEDWVGGRYSLWSSIGLSIALATGFENFRQLLDGAHEMDLHFQAAPLDRNAPVLLALLGIWNRNFLDTQNLAILPYCQSLALLPAWLQQGDMESNGKSVTRKGEAISYKTGPVIFGTPGTDCQHSYMQLVHQGTDLIPCDFITALTPDHPWPDHHKMLLANMVAQADALAAGRTLAEAGNDPQRVFTGNRPSTIIALDTLDPWHLGQLLALYEHKIFVQGVIWGINSFDQWGVELGKVLANKIFSILQNPEKIEESSILSHIKERIVY
jgi:glucose-6-phosphate isomerase